MYTPIPEEQFARPHTHTLSHTYTHLRAASFNNRLTLIDGFNLKIKEDTLQQVQSLSVCVCV